MAKEGEWRLESRNKVASRPLPSACFSLRQVVAFVLVGKRFAGAVIVSKLSSHDRLCRPCAHHDHVSLALAIILGGQTIIKIQEARYEGPNWPRASERTSEKGVMILSLAGPAATSRSARLAVAPGLATEVTSVRVSPRPVGRLATAAAAVARLPNAGQVSPGTPWASSKSPTIRPAAAALRASCTLVIQATVVVLVVGLFVYRRCWFGKNRLESIPV